MVPIDFRRDSCHETETGVRLTRPAGQHPASLLQRLAWAGAGSDRSYGPHGNSSGVPCRKPLPAFPDRDPTQGQSSVIEG